MGKEAFRIDKNFGLNPEEFEKLAEDLRSNDERLFERVFISHFQSCMTYIKNNYSASHSDAYDATMDALLDFRLRIIDGKIRYGNLRYLMTKMATQFYMRNQKKFVLQDINENDLIEDEVVDEEDFIFLDKAWNRLGEKCKSLLELHFFKGMKLINIGKTINKSPESMRKQKQRCLKKMVELYAESTKSLH